jgi:sugar phosphate isomerase/epimerase
MTAQPKFQWGISTLGCHELDLVKTCELAERHDIHTLEIRALCDRQDLPAYLDETYQNATEVQSILDQHHQNVVALNSGFKLIGAQAADREELLEFTRWAEALNIPYIRVFGGSDMADPLTAQGLDSASSSLQWWNDHRTRNKWNVRLALETHSGFSSSERCLKLSEHANEPIDIIWDTHHTWKYGNETPAQTWDHLSHLIRHVHIKDSVPIPSARHAYSYVLPGAGDFHAKDVLALLTKNNYAGIVSLEWERKWHPYMPSLDEALDALVSSQWKNDSKVLAPLS